MQTTIDLEDLAPAQREAVEELATEYAAVSPRATVTFESFNSIYLDCYDGQPDSCSVCDTMEDDHEDEHGLWDHSYRVRVPVKTFRIMPSGTRLDITPGQPGLRQRGGQL